MNVLLIALKLLGALLAALTLCAFVLLSVAAEFVGGWRNLWRQIQEWL